MKYLIAYLLNGEAKIKHESLTDKISGAFGVFRLNGHIPPHITLKKPFEIDRADDVKKVEVVLENFCKSRRKSPLKVSGFDHFGNKVVFVDVFPTTATSNLITNLFVKLGDVPWLDFDEFELNPRLHSTVAYKNIQEKFDEIWGFVSSEQFDFDVELDNIAILKKEGNKWVVHKQYFLK